MIKDKSIAERVIDVISLESGIDAVDIKTTSILTDDLGADSLDLAYIVMSIEEEFGIEIHDNKIEGVDNLKVIDLIVIVEHEVQ